MEFQASRQSQHLQQSQLQHPQGRERPSETDDSHATGGAAWDVANQDLFVYCYFRRAAQPIVRRFKRTTLEGGAGHGKQARAALSEKFEGSSREAIRAEHANASALRTGL